MPKAGVAGRDATVGPARLARAPTRSSQSPKSYWVERVGEKMAVVSPAACAMGRKGEHGKGPASYRGLGLRPAVAGLPSHLPWPPKAAAGSGLASGPLAPAFSGPFVE